MSETEPETTEEPEPTEDKPETWWKQHIGQICALQLREGMAYIGITSDNQVHTVDGNTAVTPLLQGQLHQVFQESNDDVILSLKMPAPDAQGILTVMFHAVDVAFATFPQRNLVQTP